LFDSSLKTKVDQIAKVV
jgi:glycosyl transferase, family 25